MARRAEHRSEMDEQKITFTLERETESMVRYAELVALDIPVIGTLYVSKQFLGDKPPKKLIVTVAEAEE